MGERERIGKQGCDKTRIREGGKAESILGGRDNVGHEEIKQGQERLRDNISELPRVAASDMQSRPPNETGADRNRVTGSDMTVISRFRRAA